MPVSKIASTTDAPFMDQSPKFDDAKGLPARFFMIWISFSALLMLFEIAVARQIIGALVTLMGLPFMMMANLYIKQGEFYDVRYGYQRADKNVFFLWFFPILFTAYGFILGFVIITLEILRGKLL